MIIYVQTEAVRKKGCGVCDLMYIRKINRNNFVVGERKPALVDESEGVGERVEGQICGPVEVGLRASAVLPAPRGTPLRYQLPVPTAVTNHHGQILLQRDQKIL